MNRASSTESETPTAGPELERELDRLSLEQALRDFDIANLRVRDLTQRLVEQSGELMALREQLVATQVALSDARQEIDAIRGSTTFRLGELARKVRARLRA